jgi:hypothetical protein
MTSLGFFAVGALAWKPASLPVLPVDCVGNCATISQTPLTFRTEWA